MRKTEPLEFPEVRIVEASAGSGKTHALAERYLRLIINESSKPEDIQNILAITFTRQAAREMKERILAFLKTIALGDNADSHREIIQITEKLSVDRETARDKAYKLIDYIIRNYNYFQVQTIDSFVNMILSGCSYKLKLSAHFKIKNDYSDYLSYSLDRSIDQANKDRQTRARFDDFIKQYLYLENRSGWIPKKNIEDIVSSLIYHVSIYGGSFVKSAATYEELLKEKSWIIKKVAELKKNAPEGANKTFIKTISKFLIENKNWFDLSEFSDRKTMMQRDFPANKGCVVPKKAARLWKQVQSAVSDVAWKESRAFFNCYIDIFSIVYGAFREQAKKDDTLFLGELNARARQLIAENDITVPELYLRLASKFKHYLIDEFQDTSVLRWKNLSEMITDGLSTGGSLFCVGDSKQAIFRFSGGDTGLFDHVKERFKAFGVKSLRLTNNYRSLREIVEFNNEIFSAENIKNYLIGFQPEENENDVKRLSDEDIGQISGIFSDSKQKSENKQEGGYVKVEHLEYEYKKERDERAGKRVLELISELRERFNLRDIAVLCRKNSEVEQVSGWLIEKGVPVESKKTLNLKNNRHIKEIISLLKFLNSPIDNLSFSSFILGDIFLKASGMKLESVHDFIFGLTERMGRRSRYYIYREFKESYPHVWEELVEELFRNVGFVNLYELVAEIYRKFSVLENFASFQGFFMHLLEYIKMSEDEYRGLSNFLEYFESDEEDALFVNSSGAQAVRVMSIHGAKGLEFSAVILPFLELESGDLSSEGRRGKVSYSVSSNDDEIRLLRLDQKYAILSEKIRNIYKEEYKKTLVDHLDAVYVAFTRAIEELYVLVGHKKKGISGFFPQGTDFERGKKNEKREKSAGPSPGYLPCARYRDWKLSLKEEFGDLTALKNRRNVVEGKIIHFALSRILNLADKDNAGTLETAWSDTKAVFPEAENLDKLKEKIKTVIESPSAKDIFYISGGEVFNEREVVDINGNTRRIDRLIIKKDEVWIIDYKSGEEIVEIYREQLLAYILAIEGIYLGKRVRAFILFLESANLKEIKDQT